LAINRNKIITAAQKYVQKGHLDKAIKEYQKIVQADASDLRVWLKIGDLQVKTGRREEAVATYRKVADAYAEGGFHPQASAVYKQILRLNPRNTSVYRRLADLSRQQGMVPDSLMQLEMLYKRLVKENRFKEALKVVSEMVELDPENVALRIRLAEGCSRENMRQEAVAEFRKAAELLRTSDRLQDFIKVAERLLWHDPKDVKTSKELSRIYISRQEPRRALQKLQIAFKANSQDSETLELLAEAFLALKQNQKAATILKEQGRLQLQAGKREAARKTYRRVMGLAPKDHDARKALQELEGAGATAPPDDIGDVARAEAGRGAAPRSASSESAASRAPAGRTDRAVEPEDEMLDFTGEPEIVSIDEIEEIDDIEELDADELVEAEELEEPEDEVEKVLADIEAFVKYNLYDKAAEQLQDLLARQPESVRAREKLAELLAEGGRIPEAVEEFRTLAAMVRQEDPEKAISYLDHALQMDRENFTVAEEMAELTGRSAQDIMAAVSESERSLDEDLSELSGLQILEDIEAEAEAMQPAYATQEISVHAVERAAAKKDPAFRQASTLEDDSLDELEELGLIQDEPPRSDELVDLSEMAEFGEVDFSELGENEMFGEGARKDILSTTQDASDDLSVPLPTEESWSEVSTDPERATETGASGGAKGQSAEVDLEAVGRQLEMGEDIDQELAQLEEELGALTPGPTAEKAPDTAVVDADALSAEMMAVDDGEEKGESEDDLILRPPTEEGAVFEEEAGAGEDEFLVDELDQLHETEQLIADLREATGENDAVAGVEAESAVRDEAAEAEIDFEGLDFSDVDAALEADDHTGSEAPAASAQAESGLSAEKPSAVQPDDWADEETTASVESSQIATEAAEAATRAAEAVEDQATAAEPESLGSSGEADSGGKAAAVDVSGLADHWGAPQQEDVHEDEESTATGSAEPDLATAPKAREAGASKGVEGVLRDVESALEDLDLAEDEAPPETLDAAQIAELREELAETDFFIGQDLFPDALEMLEDLKERFGEHPELLAKIASVEEQWAAAQQDEAAEAAEADEVAAAQQAVGADEIAAAKQATDAEKAQAVSREAQFATAEAAEAAEEAAPPGTAGAADSEIEETAETSEKEAATAGPLSQLEGRDAEVFKQFRDGVAQQVSEEDGETHFDLGIAYREMGMVNDAVAEFKKAMRSPQKEVQAHMMIAVCHLENGDLSSAIGEYKKALHSERITDVEQLDAYYQMGKVYAQLEDYEESIYYMEKVHKRQPKYRDVKERLDALYAQQ
jgi:tetratricopeptide (TPR) repeat protein